MPTSITMTVEKLGPGVVPEDAASCRNTALFFAGFGGPAILTFFLLNFLSAVLTQCIRNVTPTEYKVKIKPDSNEKEKVKDVEAGQPESSAAATSEQEAPLLQEEPGTESDDPPPYQAPSSTDDATVTPSPPVILDNKKKNPKRSSAERFVIATAALIPMLFSVLCVALSIQEISCNPSLRTPTFMKVVLWLLFAAVNLWNSAGLVCWAMLLGDLWRPAPKKQYPFKEMIIPLCIGVALYLPVYILIQLPISGISKGAVRLIEKCQRKFCADALDDEEEEDEGVELEEGSSAPHGEGIDAATASATTISFGSEETEGLIAGMDKA